MNSFLNELAKRLAEKWLSLLVLPGALYVAVALAAWRIGHGSWDPGARFAAELQSGKASTSEVLVAALVALLLAAAAGLAAQAAGRAVQWLWLGEWPGRIGAPLTRARRRRWDSAQDRYAAAVRAGEPPDARARLAQQRNRIALAPPARPTRMGDRVTALSTRVLVAYGLDLEFGWPRLWLVLPEETRTVVSESRDSFNTAATLAAWGVFYVPLGVLWWPTGVAGVATLLVAWIRGSAAITNLASLMESAVDLHAAALATSLGLDVPDGLMTPELGRRATRILRKGA